MKQDTKRSQIQIKEDPDVCNHRINRLFLHQICPLDAQICQKQCQLESTHERSGFIGHHEISVEQFKRAFEGLQGKVSLQAQHYIRQINQIEQKAIESIQRKKIETLKELDQFKTSLMTKTYKGLQLKYPHLYQKYKNKRYDTLKCKEVYWVMQTPRTQISVKHSQINAKFETILRKFQNFKDVSRNISSTSMTIVNKQKAKDAKCKQKIPQLLVYGRDIPTIDLQRVDYTQQRNKKIHSKLTEDIQNKYREREKITKQLQKLQSQINRTLFLKKTITYKLKICSQVMKVIEVSSQERAQKIFQNMKKHQARDHNDFLTNSTTKINSDKKILIGQLGIQQNMLEEDHLQNDNNNSKREHLQNAEQQRRINQLINSNEEQQMNQNENEQKKNNQDYANDKQQEQRNEIQNNNFVKQQYQQPQPYQPWDNTDLLSQMRNNGFKVENCLKIENIEKIRSMQIRKLNNPNKINRNCFLKSVNKNPPALGAPQQFSLMLFLKQQKKVEQQKQRKMKQMQIQTQLQQSEQNKQNQQQ